MLSLILKAHKLIMTAKTVPAAVLFAIAAPVLTLAQSNDRPQQGPDMAAVATELGVNEEVFKTCMPRPEHPTEGEAPTRPDLAGVASCLQSAGSTLSADEIETVLANNLPEHPPQRG